MVGTETSARQTSKSKRKSKRKHRHKPGKCEDEDEDEEEEKEEEEEGKLDGGKKQEKLKSRQNLHYKPENCKEDEREDKREKQKQSKTTRILHYKPENSKEDEGEGGIRGKQDQPKSTRNCHYKPEKFQEEEEVGGDEQERKDDLIRRGTQFLTDPQICLAIYIAMAHAGIVLSFALLYGLTKLLEEYLRPIQWAILCSIPLRELHTALVRFWSHPLKLGLLETLLAIPVAFLRITTNSLIDSFSALIRLLRNRPSVSCNQKIGFSKLMNWMVAFGLFVVVHERIGTASVPAFGVPCYIAYATGYGTSSSPGIAKTLSAISSVRHSRRIVIKISLWSRISRYLTSRMLRRLKTMVSIGLIAFMIVGSMSGLLFFSYKIGIEGKDAVISLKTHLEDNNYAERIGLKRWMDENHVPKLIDTYTAKFYETVSQQIDSLALHYNVTEIVEGFRHYLIKPLNTSFVSPEQVSHKPFSEKLYFIQSRLRKREWKLIVVEIYSVFKEFISVIARKGTMEKIKCFLLQSVDTSKQVLASSGMILVGSANLLFSVAVSIVSGAAGLLNFISQLMVFFWLLYYLITTDSNGVMDHVLGMLPLSKSTRVRCAEVLDHAVSSVLLAAAKVTFFQGCFTYLLFRFYRIHFLYMSTFLALMSAMLPITPMWLSTIPAAAQLAMEARFVEAFFLTVIHLVLLEYGTAAIKDEIPGQHAYLTGLSILGGIALFPSVLEGAIMGPLLMTVMITMKNLYVEFFLASSKEISREQSWDL